MGNVWKIGVLASLLLNVATVGLLVHRAGDPWTVVKSEPAKTPIADPNPPATAATSSPGRYVIVISPHAERGTYLLDTQEGRVWAHTTFTDLKGEPDVWLYMDRLDDGDQLREFSTGFQLITPKTNEAPKPKVPPPPPGFKLDRPSPAH
jgi:hypothetical protein